MRPVIKALTLVMGLAGAVAATRSAYAAPINVVVEYVTPQIFDPAYKQIKAEFERENPGINIVYRNPQNDYDAGIQTLLREAVTSNMPDVAFVGLAQLRVVYDRKLAVDLAPLIATDGTTFEASGWNKGLQAAAQVEGEQIGLPFALSMPMVYFNADLVKRAGGTLSAMPRDWNGLIGLGGKIAALGGDTGGIYQSFTGLNGAWYFQGMVYGANGQIMEKGAKTVAFGDHAGLDALQLYRRMVVDGGMPPITEEAARQQFMAGKLGLFLDSASRIAGYQASIGGRFQLGTAFYPSPDGKPQGLVTGGSAGVVTIAATKNLAQLAAAWRFVKFASGPYGTTAVIKTVGYTPVNTLALSDPSLLKGYFDDKPNYRIAVEQLPQLREWYQFPGSNGVKINNTIGDQITAVVDGSATPAIALKSMVSEVNGLLSQ